MRSKKAFMPVWILISIVIALFIFFVLLGVFSGKLHFFAVNIRDCESKGASCVEESRCLAPLGILPYNCEQEKGKERIVCCK